MAGQNRGIRKKPLDEVIFYDRVTVAVVTELPGEFPSRNGDSIDVLEEEIEMLYKVEAQ